jgi:hypothetical protein
MPTTIQLRDRQLDYRAAASDDKDVLREANELLETIRAGDILSRQADEIRQLVAHHFRLGSTDGCVVATRDRWIYGRFNVCVPVEVQKHAKRVLVRCPMQHALAESFYPGTVDEKISCEVATYAWMQENSPDISIPGLIGFGFRDGRHVRCSLRPRSTADHN